MFRKLWSIQDRCPNKFVLTIRMDRKDLVARKSRSMAMLRAAKAPLAMGAWRNCHKHQEVTTGSPTKKNIWTFRGYMKLKFHMKNWDV